MKFATRLHRMTFTPGSAATKVVPGASLAELSLCWIIRHNCLWDDLKLPVIPAQAGTHIGRGHRPSPV